MGLVMGPCHGNPDTGRRNSGCGSERRLHGEANFCRALPCLWEGGCADGSGPCHLYELVTRNERGGGESERLCLLGNWKTSFLGSRSASSCRGCWGKCLSHHCRGIWNDGGRCVVLRSRKQRDEVQTSPPALAKTFGPMEGSESGNAASREWNQRPWRLKRWNRSTCGVREERLFHFHSQR